MACALWHHVEHQWWKPEKALSGNGSSRLSCRPLAGLATKVSNGVFPPQAGRRCSAKTAHMTR